MILFHYLQVRGGRDIGFIMLVSIQLRANEYDKTITPTLRYNFKGATDCRRQKHYAHYLLHPFQVQWE